LDNDAETYSQHFDAMNHAKDMVHFSLGQ
jgi:hypothetical protein